MNSILLIRKKIPQILILLILNIPIVFALPVLNSSVATNSIYTVYSDHLDENLYYVSPNIMSIAVDDDGVPKFSYQEFKVNFFKKSAVLNFVMKVSNYMQDLLQVKETIRSYNANAKFAVIPFISSRLAFGIPDDDLRIKSHSCNHIGSVYGSEQGCSIILTSVGRRAFRKSITQPIAMLLTYYYIIDGVILLADGTYKNTKIEHSIVANGIGSNLLAFPMLFVNSRGHKIHFK